MRIHKKVLASLVFSTLCGTAHVSAASYGLAISTSNQLTTIDVATGAIINAVNISGLAAGESLLGFDLRPSNGMVYGISNANKLYTFNVNTGATTFVSTLTGASFNATGGIGIDFNPVADTSLATPAPASLRVTTGTGQNYAVNVNTGTVTVATSIGAGHTGVAYINSAEGVTPASTGLYYINTATDSLEFLGSNFNNPALGGGIQTKGSLGLGFDILSANGFDIFSNGLAYAVLQLDDGTGKSGLYSINLTNGSATLKSTLNGTFNGFTQAPSSLITPVPEPETYGMFATGMGLLYLVARRRQRVTA